MKNKFQRNTLFDDNPVITQNSALEKIKTTNVNILLNRVKLDEKKDFKKKIVFVSIMMSVLLGFGIFSVVIGIYISVETDIPSGPSIVVVSAVLFFLSHFFGKFLKKE